MRKIKIVTDTVSNLTEKLANTMNITLIPFYVMIEDKTFKDNEPTVKDRVYQALRQGKRVGTSHPTLMDYVETMKKLHEKGYQILYLTVSRSWTLSFDIALKAVKRIGDEGIEVMDTKTALGHLGLTAIEVARFTETEDDLEEVKSYAQQILERGNLFFVLDTLKYLARSGRIGRVKSILGSALRLTPVLTVVGGVADVAAKTFSEKQALSWIVKRLKSERKKFKGKRMLISVEAGDRLEWRDFLHTTIKREFPDAEIYELRMSPVVTCHTGPGLWGVSYIFP